jgi:hypothetical protein
MENVYQVYSLLLISVAASQRKNNEISSVLTDEEAFDQFLFYTDSNRGILGRISVPSNGRLRKGPYYGDKFNIENVYY